MASGCKANKKFWRIDAAAVKGKRFHSFGLTRERKAGGKRSFPDKLTKG